MPLAPQELRTYFTTFSTLGRRRRFSVSTLEVYRMQGKFALHAFVVMPDHVHVLLTPAHHVSLEKALQYIKGRFSFRLKSSFDVWERGHFDKRVPDRAAYEACVVYIDQNPVKERLSAVPSEYPYCSEHGAVELDPMPPCFQ